MALPHGHAHSLIDDPGITAAQPLEELLVCRARGDGSVFRVGGGGESATIVSGRFRFEDRRNNPLLSVLPPVITLKGEMGKSVLWLEPTLKFIACEAASGRPGSQTVIARLADVLFIQIVRGHLASLPANGSGWLGALADAQIGAALGHIHQNPSRIGQCSRWPPKSRCPAPRSPHASCAWSVSPRCPTSPAGACKKLPACCVKASKRWPKLPPKSATTRKRPSARRSSARVGSAPGAYRRGLRQSGLEVAA